MALSRALMRPLAVLTLLCLAFLGAGCKTKCRQLSEKLCECALNSIDKEACVRRASSEEGRLQPTDEQEAQCETLLSTCDCHTVDTTQGKVNCGLAWPSPVK